MRDENKPDKSGKCEICAGRSPILRGGAEISELVEESRWKGETLRGRASAGHTRDGAASPASRSPTLRRESVPTLDRSYREGETADSPARGQTKRSHTARPCLVPCSPLTSRAA